METFENFTKIYLIIGISIFVLGIMPPREFNFEKHHINTELNKLSEENNRNTIEVLSRKNDVPEKEENISPDENSKPQYKEVLTTLFWVGETANKSNAFISNYGSAWQTNWQEDFGGIDNPDERCGFKPCDFEPKENPFYFALPYNDLTLLGNRKKSAEDIPWFDEYKDNKSVLKNRWVEIVYENKKCYAQWQDVGPLETDDFDYVFGSSDHKNTFGVEAGLDISPATWDCLNLSTNSLVKWRFIEDEEVPSGPWKEIVTTGDVKYD